MQLKQINSFYSFLYSVSFHCNTVLYNHRHTQSEYLYRQQQTEKGMIEKQTWSQKQTCLS